MKKTIIGICVSVLGMMGVLAVTVVAGLNMPSGWSTPPGRFMTAVQDSDIGFLLGISAVLVVLGLVILGIEYFKKDRA